VPAAAFHKGDLVAVKTPHTRAEKTYKVGLVVKPPSHKSRLYEILWLTSNNSYVTVYTEGRNLVLLSAPEGNEARFRRWRAT